MLWDPLLLAMKQMTLSHRKFVKKLKSLTNFHLTEKRNSKRDPIYFILISRSVPWQLNAGKFLTMKFYNGTKTTVQYGATILTLN